MGSARSMSVALGCICVLMAAAQARAEVVEELAAPGDSSSLQSPPLPALAEPDVAVPDGVRREWLSLRIDYGSRGSLRDIPGSWPDIHGVSSSLTEAGMATVGYTWRQLRLEGALLHGRSGDVGKNAESSPPESTTTRLVQQWKQARKLSYQLAPNWTLRFSRGYFNSPDLLRPDAVVRRRTLSAIHDGAIGGKPWSTIVAWGRGSGDSDIVNTYLLESAIHLDEAATLFGRLERAGNDELFQEEIIPHRQSYSAGKLTFGYLHDLAKDGPTRLSVGGSVSRRFLPAELTPYYGGNAVSYSLFLRLQLRY